MSGIIDRLKREFQDEDYRYAYDEGFSNAQLATQLKVIREQRNLTQAELANQADMKQSRISALENVNYSAWSISTLRRLARALGVRLAFRFESWAELLPQVEEFGRESLQRPTFTDDSAFQITSEQEKVILGKVETSTNEVIPFPHRKDRKQRTSGLSNQISFDFMSDVTILFPSIQTA